MNHSETFPKFHLHDVLSGIIISIFPEAEPIANAHCANLPYSQTMKCGVRRPYFCKRYSAIAQEICCHLFSCDHTIRFSMVFYRHMILPETSTKRNEKRPSIKRIQDTIVPIHRLATGQAATSQYLVQLISIQNLWSRGKRIGKVPFCVVIGSFGVFYQPSLSLIVPFSYQRSEETGTCLLTRRV